MEIDFCLLYGGSEMALEWIAPEEGRKNTLEKLYLVYKIGYPLMVCDWKTGHGYREVTTGMSVSPDLVAYINMPNVKF